MATPKKTPYIAETFDATGDSGATYRLRQWNYKIEQTMLSGPPAILFSPWKIESTDGQHVNVEADGSMSFAATGEKLTRT